MACADTSPGDLVTFPADCPDMGGTVLQAADALRAPACREAVLQRALVLIKARKALRAALGGGDGGGIGTGCDRNDGDGDGACSAGRARLGKLAASVAELGGLLMYAPGKVALAGAPPRASGIVLSVSTCAAAAGGKVSAACLLAYSARVLFAAAVRLLSAPAGVGNRLAYRRGARAALDEIKDTQVQAEWKESGMCRTATAAAEHEDIERAVLRLRRRLRVEATTAARAAGDDGGASADGEWQWLRSSDTTSDTTPISDCATFRVVQPGYGKFAALLLHVEARAQALGSCSWTVSDVVLTAAETGIDTRLATERVRRALCARAATVCALRAPSAWSWLSGDSRGSGGGGSSVETTLACRHSELAARGAVVPTVVGAITAGGDYTVRMYLRGTDWEHSPAPAAPRGARARSAPAATEMSVFDALASDALSLRAPHLIVGILWRALLDERAGEGSGAPRPRRSGSTEASPRPPPSSSSSSSSSFSPPAAHRFYGVLPAALARECAEVSHAHGGGGGGGPARAASCGSAAGSGSDVVVSAAATILLRLLCGAMRKGASAETAVLARAAWSALCDPMQTSGKVDGGWNVSTRLIVAAAASTCVCDPCAHAGAPPPAADADADADAAAREAARFGQRAAAALGGVVLALASGTEHDAVGRGVAQVLASFSACPSGALRGLACGKLTQPDGPTRDLVVSTLHDPMPSPSATLIASTLDWWLSTTLCNGAALAARALMDRGAVTGRGFGAEAAAGSASRVSSSAPDASLVLYESDKLIQKKARGRPRLHAGLDVRRALLEVVRHAERRFKQQVSLELERPPAYARRGAQGLPPRHVLARGTRAAPGPGAQKQRADDKRHVTMLAAATRWARRAMAALDVGAAARRDACFLVANARDVGAAMAAAEPAPDGSGRATGEAYRGGMLLRLVYDGVVGGRACTIAAWADMPGDLRVWDGVQHQHDLWSVVRGGRANLGREAVPTAEMLSAASALWSDAAQVDAEAARLAARAAEDDSARAAWLHPAKLACLCWAAASSLCDRASLERVIHSAFVLGEAPGAPAPAGASSSSRGRVLRPGDADAAEIIAARALVSCAQPVVGVSVDDGSRWLECAARVEGGRMRDAARSVASCAYTDKCVGEAARAVQRCVAVCEAVVCDARSGRSSAVSVDISESASTDAVGGGALGSPPFDWSGPARARLEWLAWLAASSVAGYSVALILPRRALVAGRTLACRVATLMRVRGALLRLLVLMLRGDTWRAPHHRGAALWRPVPAAGAGAAAAARRAVERCARAMLRGHSQAVILPHLLPVCEQWLERELRAAATTLPCGGLVPLHARDGALAAACLACAASAVAAAAPTQTLFVVPSTSAWLWHDALFLASRAVADVTGGDGRRVPRVAVLTPGPAGRALSENGTLLDAHSSHWCIVTQPHLYADGMAGALATAPWYRVVVGAAHGVLASGSAAKRCEILRSLCERASSTWALLSPRAAGGGGEGAQADHHGPSGSYLKTALHVASMLSPACRTGSGDVPDVVRLHVGWHHTGAPPATVGSLPLVRLPRPLPVATDGGGAGGGGAGKARAVLHTATGGVTPSGLRMRLVASGVDDASAAMLADYASRPEVSDGDSILDAILLPSASWGDAGPRDLDETLAALLRRRSPELEGDAQETRAPSHDVAPAYTAARLAMSDVIRPLAHDVDVFAWEDTRGRGRTTRSRRYYTALDDSGREDAWADVVLHARKSVRWRVHLPVSAMSDDAEHELLETMLPVRVMLRPAVSVVFTQRLDTACAVARAAAATGGAIRALACDSGGAVVDASAWPRRDGEGGDAGQHAQRVIVVALDAEESADDKSARTRGAEPSARSAPTLMEVARAEGDRCAMTVDRLVWTDAQLLTDVASMRAADAFLAAHSGHVRVSERQPLGCAVYS